MEKETKKPTGNAAVEVVPAIVIEDETETPKMEVIDTPIMAAYTLPNQAQITEYETFLTNYDAFVDRVLKNGTDYGVIPGVDKPSLFKPGAEKLEKLFFLRHKKDCVLKEVHEGGKFIRYTYRTSVFNKNGQLVATCEGTCNSHEKKYRIQTVYENQATEEQKATGRLEERMGRNNTKYKVYVVEKPDFYDVENTIMKMAQKRSYVGAILEATNSSSRFTADAEDTVPPAADGNETKPKQPAPAKYVTPIMFERVKESIMNTDDVGQLEEMRKKIQASEKYSKEMKKELDALISEAVAAIKK